MNVGKKSTNQREWAENLYWLGLVCLDRNQYETAENAFSEALILDPLHFESLYWRGILHAMKSQHKSAAIDFIDCLSIEPGRSEAYLKLATIQHAAGQTNNAFKNFAHYISTQT